MAAADGSRHDIRRPGEPLPYLGEVVLRPVFAFLRAAYVHSRLVIPVARLTRRTPTAYPMDWNDFIGQNPTGALLAAVESGNIPAARGALYNGADIHYEMDGALQIAKYMNRDSEMERILLAYGANPDVAKRGYLGISAAIREGNIEALRDLLDDGVDINQVRDGNTPITYAVEMGRVDMVNLLLDRGANPAGALETAVGMEDEEMIELLLDRDVNMAGAIHIAEELRNVHILQAFAAHGAIVDLDW